jgi:hypothetical protein
MVSFFSQNTQENDKMPFRPIADIDIENFGGKI